MTPRPHFKLGTDGRLAPALRSRSGPPAALLDDENRGLASGGIGPAGITGPRWYAPGIRDAAGDTLRALPLQRSASRQLVRTNPIAAGAIQTNVDRVIGTGLALVASPDRDVLGWTEQQALDWKRKVQQEYSLWADSTDSDWSGEMNFYDKQALTLRSALESGDCFTVLPDAPASNTQPYRLRIQTIEADRVANPAGQTDTAEIVAGVRRPAGSGVPASYFFLDRHPGSAIVAPKASPLTGQWVDRIGSSGRRRVLHHFRQLRPDQPRGVPYLSPIVGHLQQLGRYTEAEIKAAVVTALLTLVIESERGTGPAPVFGLTDSQMAANPEIELGSGAVIGLSPGEKANLINPLRPNPEFEPFIRSILQQIGIGLGLPLELLTKKFDASYSASKAALLDAWQWFRGQRTWLARSFCQPVYETWLAEAISTGRIAAPGFFRYPLMRWAYTRAAWHGDSQGSINPKDEVAAYLAAVDGRIMTRERAEWELGGTDWYETFDSKKTENEMLKAADMLPVPKAGAAAPQSGSDTPADPGSSGASAAAPHVTVNLQQGDTTIHLDGKTAAVETVMPASITVEPASADVDLGAFD